MLTTARFQVPWITTVDCVLFLVEVDFKEPIHVLFENLSPNSEIRQTLLSG